MSDIIRGELVANKNGEWFVRLKGVSPSLIIHRQIKEANVQLIDSRPLSDEQRRMCYALIHAISDWSGTDDQSIKELFKLRFLTENVQELGEEIFSLSNAPMSLVAAFQRYLVKFIIENDVPVKRPLIDYVDDIQDYTYNCLIHKKCCVCGKRAELHHIDRVGLGRNRDEIIHEGMEAISLCRLHHDEIHSIGTDEFMNKYHLQGGIELDKTLCKIYKLKSKKESSNE